MRLLNMLPWWAHWYIQCLQGRHGQGFWRIFPKLGYKTIVAWPGTNETSDPNEIMREWLEENAGWQGICWSWEIASITDHPNGLIVRFVNKQHAMMFKLIYG